jgi:hypothetical protein
MRALVGRWQKQVLVVVAAGLSLGGSMRPAQQARRPSQGQVAGQFLRAVLRANYGAAYHQLAPEVRQTVNQHHFEAAARPLWKGGQRHGIAIELYKLGMRIGESGASRLFYSFSFAADSSLKVPTELLEVTFRDTASRAILSFGLRATVVPAKKPAPTVKTPKKTVRAGQGK